MNMFTSPRKVTKIKAFVIASVLFLTAIPFSAMADKLCPLQDTCKMPSFPKGMVYYSVKAPAVKYTCVLTATSHKDIKATFKGTGGFEFNEVVVEADRGGKAVPIAGKFKEGANEGRIEVRQHPESFNADGSVKCSVG